MSVYDTCTAQHGGGTDNLPAVLQCVSSWVETMSYELGNATAAAAAGASSIPEGTYVNADELNSWLLVLAGSMVFFMQAGFAMVCAGAIRKKNVNNTMIKNLLDACGAGLAFCFLGYGIAYGGSTDGSWTFVGNGNFFLLGDINPAFVFFQYAFSATAVTIVAGTLAERCKMASYFAYSFLLSGFVYPVVVHNFWSDLGLFSPTNDNVLLGMGMVDYSGSAVIHVTGGTTALYAAYILGARRGRFYDRDGRPLSKPGLTKGHSLSLQMLGTMILWFCWYGFNSGSALLLPTLAKGSVAARAAVNTTIGAAAGTLSCLLANGILQERLSGEFVLDIVMAMNGCLSGLVAVTAGCGVMDYWAALIVGLVSGFVYIGADALLIKLKIDDAVSAIPVHLANGLWGVLSVGLFARPSLLMQAYGKDSHAGLFFVGFGNSLMPAQIIGTIFIIAWTFITMGPFFIALDYMGWFRVNELEELVGLDATYLGTSAQNDDDASENEDLRLAAYRQRFEERKQMRENKPVKTMTVDALLNESFFGPASGMGPPSAPPKDLLLSDDSAPEQANARSNNKLLNESCDL